VTAQQEGKGRLSSFEEGKVRGGKDREGLFHVMKKATCFPRLSVVVEEVVPLSSLLQCVSGTDPVGPPRWSSISMMVWKQVPMRSSSR